MNEKDLIITPVLFILILILGYFIRDRVSDDLNRKFFFPALVLKLLGSIMVGLIYQYYYRGGDTYVFFHQGSYYLWKAFMQNPWLGLKIIFGPHGQLTAENYEYASNILYFHDSSSFFVIRIAGILDLFTFHTYSSTALLFASISFSGLWALYITFYRMYPRLYLPIAIAVFFIPSVFFWGSGLLKDSITIGALGWSVFSFSEIFFKRRNVVLNAFILGGSFYLLAGIKIYILLCFAPSLIVWLYLNYISVIKNLVARIMILPVMLAVGILTAYIAVSEIGEKSSRYNVENLAKTAEATSRWISYVSEREGGSTYNLGDYDYSLSGILNKSYKAVWVTLYRPYIWESKNPVMLLSALESMAMLLLTLYILVKSGPVKFFRYAIFNPTVFFCLVFTLTFSFAVGISTYNFGSLVRYKIPMMPFFLVSLFLIDHYSNRPKKPVRLEVVEK